MSSSLFTRGSNFVTEVRDDPVGHLKDISNYALDKVRGPVMEQIMEGVGNYQPVYKIMITTPRLKDDGSIIVHRTRIADTSRSLKTFMGLGNSSIIGLWVDKSDLAEPDKAIVLMSYPTSTEAGTYESDIMNFPQFGVGNWLDIWIGYKPMGSDVVAAGAKVATLLKENPDFRLLTLANYPITLPDPFCFGFESHVFSGPIVSCKRSVTMSGDRLQLIGFSPIMLLKSAIIEKVEIDSKKLLKDAIMDAVKLVHPMPDITCGMDEDYVENKSKRAYMGLLPWHMMTGGGTSESIIVDPVVRSIGTVFESWSQRDNDLISGRLTDPDYVLNAPITGRYSLYNLFFGEFTDSSNTNLEGMTCSIQYQESPDPRWAFEDGTGHPGFRIQYGFEFQIEGILQRRREGVGGYRNSVQKLKLGRSAREFEAGIEWGSVFNTRKYQGKFSDEEESVGVLKSYICPTDAIFLREVLAAINPNNPERESKFWEYLLRSIYVYGETTMEPAKFLRSKTGNVINLSKPENLNLFVRDMRRVFFAGMSGSVYGIGNPSIKPGRVLEIIDYKKTLTGALKKGFDGVLGKKLGSIPLPAMQMRNVDKNFYVWKVRHYLGVNTGYITKTYFMEERNRSWQQFTTSIDSIIAKALAQAKQSSQTLAGR